MYEDRTGTARYFNRDWMRDFRERYKESIKKVIADVLEIEMSQISVDEVEKYIHDIEELMIDPPNPFLFINFNETGFERRPDKGKRKKCTFKKKTAKQSHFLKKNMIYIISH